MLFASVFCWCSIKKQFHDGAYVLVHVKKTKQILSPANAALAISRQRVNLISYFLPRRLEESDMASIFNGLRLSLGAKLVTPNDRPSCSSILFRLFPSGGERKKYAPHFLHEPVGGTPRHVCRNFRAKNRRSDPPVFHIKQNLAKQLDPTPKPRNLKEITYLTHFCA